MKESDSEDEEIAYNSAYKTKCTGLGALLGTLRADPSPDVDALQSPPSALKDKSYLQTVCDTGGANAGPRLVASQRVTEFRCDLCDLELNSESMYFQHIQGQKHSKRLKIHQTVNSNANLRTLIEESTSPVVGDIKYPWPAGKAPWSVEQGGSGVAPPGSGDTECSVNSSEDAELAFQASRTLIQRLIQYKVPLCEQSKVTSLKACGDNLIQSLETIMMMPTQNPSRLDSGPRTPPSPDRDHFTMRSQRMGKKRAYPLSTQDGPSHY
eukprot:TCALIF_11697-PA protein Name:"Protein of unknown function" AED:0.79 eAED:0.86 QI:0/0/0/0.4/0.75/0.6/5/0/266